MYGPLGASAMLGFDASVSFIGFSLEVAWQVYRLHSSSYLPSIFCGLWTPEGAAAEAP